MRLEEALHRRWRATEQQVIVHVERGAVGVGAHVVLTILGVVECVSHQVRLLAPGSGSVGLVQRVYFLADADEVLSLGIVQTLQEFGDGDAHGHLADAYLRLFGLLLAVLGLA